MEYGAFSKHISVTSPQSELSPDSVAQLYLSCKCVIYYVRLQFHEY